MSHTLHAHIKHAHDVAHDDANGVAALTARYIASLEAAGHRIEDHGLHRHGHGEVHLPKASHDHKPAA